MKNMSEPGLLVIVPFKGLRLAKSRLRKLLNDKLREELAESMLQHVINQIHKCECVNRIVVLLKENDIKEIKGVDIELDHGNDLNESISIILNKSHSSYFMVIMSDLPLLTSRGINKIAKLIQENRTVIVPTRDGGTSILGGCFPFDQKLFFGPNSFARFRKNYTNFIFEMEESASIDVDNEYYLNLILEEYPNLQFSEKWKPILKNQVLKKK